MVNVCYVPDRRRLRIWLHGFLKTVSSRISRSGLMQGKAVVDPFSGSGTTAKMAFRYGRHFICADVCETYCELSRRRVADEQQRQQAE